MVLAGIDNFVPIGNTVPEYTRSLLVLVCLVAAASYLYELFVAVYGLLPILILIPSVVIHTLLFLVNITCKSFLLMKV